MFSTVPNSKKIIFITKFPESLSLLFYLNKNPKRIYTVELFGQLNYYYSNKPHSYFIILTAALRHYDKVWKIKTDLIVGL